MEEAKLIKLVKDKGDKVSANKLIKIYYKKIYIYVYKQTSCKELSKDLTQDIFISMLRSIKDFDFSKSSFQTWIYRIASNKVIDYYRSKAYKYTTKVSDIEEFEFKDSINIERELIQKERVQEVLEVVNRFESNIQQIFRLKVFGEMTFKEISNVLSLSESTVKTKYYSSIKKLKKEVGEKINV
ncbi:sigma-70 family RNA polymerase sigma factor [uncultured Clostridium sp.]|uniref:RNA polymerase sigma factor n=1 Tax=uncultured Clostridium sp. TaxID=59620 RepID=UPI00260C6C7F|nr:sigma-70 family RNA polymerase sigma factor [uncultured Clostridium sp.]